MDKAKVFKTLLGVAGTVLTLGATLINNKVSDDKMKDTVAAEVKKALENQLFSIRSRY